MSAYWETITEKLLPGHSPSNDFTVNMYLIMIVIIMMVNLNNTETKLSSYSYLAILGKPQKLQRPNLNV